MEIYKEIPFIMEDNKKYYDGVNYKSLVWK